MVEYLMMILRNLNAARRRGDMQAAWDSCDDLAGLALHAEGLVKARALRELESLRPEFEASGCSVEEFACLSAFWSLPSRGYPAAR